MYLLRIGIPLHPWFSEAKGKGKGKSKSPAKPLGPRKAPSSILKHGCG